MSISIRTAASVLFCAAAVTLSGCVGPEHLNEVPPTPGATFTASLYVADSGTNDVSIIDSTGKVAATVAVGNSPSAIAFDADPGHVPLHAYVANRSSNTVTVINVADNSIAATIPVGAAPDALAYGSGGIGNSFIFVANSGDGTVSQIDTGSLKVVTTYKVGQNPAALRANNGNEFGVLNAGDTDINIVETTNQKIIATLPLTAPGIGVSIDNGTVYGATADGVLHPFTEDPATGKWSEGTDLLTGASAQYAKEIYTNDWAFINSQAGTVALYDTFSRKILQTLTVGANPVDAILHVGSNANNPPLYVYVANKGSDSVSWFSGTDLSKMTAQPVIALKKGAQPDAVAIYEFWQIASPSPSASPSPTPTPSATPTPTPTPAPSATPAAQHLYVANYGGNTVAQYAMPLTNASAPSLTFADSTPVGGPIGIAVNSAYVVTSHVTGSVYAYQQPVSASSTPAATFGGSAMGLMAFDAQGNLWSTSQNSSVVEYVPPFTNSTLEAKSLTAGFTDSYGIAFDSSANMYVSNGDSSANIVVYAPPYTAPANSYVVPGTNIGLRGVAVSGSNLFVADAHNSLIYVYTLPLTTNIPSDAFTASRPVGLAFDASGKLYVSSQGTSQVQVFNPPFNSGSVPAMTITSGVNGAYGVAIGP